MVESFDVYYEEEILCCRMGEVIYPELNGNWQPSSSRMQWVETFLL